MVTKYWKAIRDFFLEEIMNPIETNIRVFFERSQRAIAFAIFSWDKYDFESDSMYALMAFKLERVKKCMDEGYGVYPKDVRDAMKESIKICKRLYARNYDKPYKKLHDKKWGPIRILDRKKPFDWTLNRKNVKTKADGRRESKDNLRYAELAWQDKMTDFDRLNHLLKTYQNHWWD